ncbi:hypothetical protein CerSpe_070680 [Prunus speciosa]
MMWEHYLAGFTEVDENSDSTKIFFAISLEALDRHNHAKPVRILQKDLKTLLTFGDEFFDEVSSLFLPMVICRFLSPSTYDQVKIGSHIQVIIIVKLPLFLLALLCNAAFSCLACRRQLVPWILCLL